MFERRVVDPLCSWYVRETPARKSWETHGKTASHDRWTLSDTNADGGFFGVCSSRSAICLAHEGTLLMEACLRQTKVGYCYCSFGSRGG
jgi:hypothetical protein